MSVRDTHEEKETLAVDINIPGHEARTTTALFTRTKNMLIHREGGRCFVSGLTAEESGHPLEAHHHPIERSMANMIDWRLFAIDCKAGKWGPHAARFDWDGFFEGAAQHVVTIPARQPGEQERKVVFIEPVDPYRFVDDMTVNGMLLAKQFHTGKDEGIHMLPFPLWIAQKYGKEGYQFSPNEVIHHGEAA